MNSLATTISNGVFLCFVVGIPLYGAYKRIHVYDVFVEGAKSGFDTMVQLVPFLVAMLVAIGMLRASGFFNVMSRWLSPALKLISFPTELLPLALVRPFSGSASNGVMADIIHTHGGDAYISKVAATMMGSTETTFFVVAVYFGAVNIKRTRYAIPAGLLADLAGIIASVLVCRYLFL